MGSCTCVTPRLVHNGRHDDDGGHGRPASNHRDGDNETESESAWQPGLRLRAVE